MFERTACRFSLVHLDGSFVVSSQYNFMSVLLHLDLSLFDSCSFPSNSHFRMPSSYVKASPGYPCSQGAEASFSCGDRDPRCRYSWGLWRERKCIFIILLHTWLLCKLLRRRELNRAALDVSQAGAGDVQILLGACGRLTKISFFTVRFLLFLASTTLYWIQAWTGRLGTVLLV